MYLMELECAWVCLFLLQTKLSHPPFPVFVTFNWWKHVLLIKARLNGQLMILFAGWIDEPGMCGNHASRPFPWQYSQELFYKESGLPLSSLSHCAAFGELGKRSGVWSRKFQRRQSEFTVGAAECKKLYSSCFPTTPGMWRFSLRPSRRASMTLTQRPDLWPESKSICLFVLFG